MVEYEVAKIQKFASLQAGTHGTNVQAAQIDLSRYANGVYFIKAVAVGNVMWMR